MKQKLLSKIDLISELENGCKPKKKWKIQTAEIKEFQKKKWNSNFFFGIYLLWFLSILISNHSVF